MVDHAFYSRTIKRTERQIKALNDKLKHYKEVYRLSKEREANKRLRGKINGTK